MIVCLWKKTWFNFVTMNVWNSANQKMFPTAKPLERANTQPDISSCQESFFQSLPPTTWTSTTKSKFSVDNIVENSNWKSCRFLVSFWLWGTWSCKIRNKKLNIFSLPIFLTSGHFMVKIPFKLILKKFGPPFWLTTEKVNFYN